MIAITHFLIYEHGMRDLKIITNQITINKGMKNINDINNNNNNNNNNSKKNEIFLINNCEMHQINDDIFISIKRVGDIVSYIFYSNNDILKDFIDQCTNNYNKMVPLQQYKYTLKMYATEHNTCSYMTTYPKEICALIHILISTCNIHNTKIIKDTMGGNIIVLDEISEIKINNIIVSVNLKSDTTRDSKVYEYELKSDIDDVSLFLEKCVGDYDDYLLYKKGKSLYYFKYVGSNNGLANFTKYTISDNCIKNETFDNLFNEHVETIKKDVMRLKDDEYYKRTGLRRKKSYLLYGEPGCGKNATVLATAIYDKRHIIDIPFSKIGGSRELENIMNLTEILGVKFNKNEIILMFDEMDYGMDSNNNNNKKYKYKKYFGPANNTDNIDNMDNTDKCGANMNDCYNDDLNMGSILSMLDGIYDYSGIMIFGMTNNIEKMQGALSRELRLTPMYFTYMRRQDILYLIEKFYNNKVPSDYIDKIPDRKLTPAKVRSFCEKYEDINIIKFIDILNSI